MVYGEIHQIHENLKKIVERKDGSKTELQETEINTGIYIFNNQILFSNINKINNRNNQSEYYLPDVLPVMLKNKHQILSKNILPGLRF